MCRCYEADEGPPQSSLTLLHPDLAIEGDYQMDQTTFTLSANTLYCALELSKNSWLLAIQFPDREQPSLHSIAGGNTVASPQHLSHIVGWTKCANRRSTA